MDKLRLLDLFSGIGGFSLGLERTGGFETVAFCEIEEFPRKVLKKHWPEVPCYHDIRELDGSSLAIDAICGGYPCQPFSVAGKREGERDDRHLWPEMFRIICEAGPQVIFAENVAGHVNMGLDKVLSDLEGQGYAVEPYIIPACAVDAPHRRDRVWIVAYTTSKRRTLQRNTVGKSAQQSSEERQWHAKNKAGKFAVVGQADFVAHANSVDAQGIERGSVNSEKWPASRQRPLRSQNSIGAWRWPPEPCIRRVANGVPNRVDRLKALGNAVVPQIPELLGNAYLESIGWKEAA